MAHIATYVFLDLETTGLPKEQNNRTKITEFSLIAVKRNHLLLTRPGASPRVQHKLTLCVNPGKLIEPSCTEVTGLCNDLLEHEPYFDIRVCNLINNFINVLEKPVCLVAQNGNNFDFPILKSHFKKHYINFSDELMYADCYFGFHDILEERKSKIKPTALACNIENNDTVDSDLFSLKNTLDMKKKNENTPVKRIQAPCLHKKEMKSRQRFPWSQGSKSKDSYKLKNIYERLLNRPAIDAHRAENDCILALECSVVLANEFVQWVDSNCAPFTDVKPMTIGVPIGL